MSIVDTNRECPLCGKTVDHVATGNFELNTRTREERFICGDSLCGFAWFSNIKEFNGRKFWVETTHYPIDQDGTVRRPRTEVTASEEPKKPEIIPGMVEF